MDTENVIKNEVVKVESTTVWSQYLEREVVVDIYLPAQTLVAGEVSLLLINDGQDLPKMNFKATLSKLLTDKTIEPILCVGIHAGQDRTNEYGVAFSADYAGRGAKAGLYTKFIMDELLPFIRMGYLSAFKDKSFAGFSLGALSALDIVWNHACEFLTAGVFSGSLWWRRKAYDDGYDDDKDKLMHLQVRTGIGFPWLKFFIQCGALDESADRNNNDIIDSIDDALDLVKELKAKGYTDDHIKFLLLDDGSHDIDSWAKAVPEFLVWNYKI